MNVVQTALKVNRQTAARLVHEGAVICRGYPVTQTHQSFRVGDQVEIDYVPQPGKIVSKKSKSATARFEVVYDDEHLIVVNKPAGLLTVPTPRRERNTLVSQIRKWLQQNHSTAQAVCVHRLDRGVSGLLVFAKDYATADLLRDQFAARKPHRKYIAIVAGKPDEKSGVFSSYLTTDSKTLTRYSVKDPREGELAITKYRVKEYWRGVTLVEVELETGRRNQIRVHFAEAGHPILGDPRYRPSEAEHRLWPYSRLALHAETLAIAHPTSGELLKFTASWPQEFRDLRRQLNKPD